MQRRAGEKLCGAPQWEDGAGSLGQACCSEMFYKHPKLCNYSLCLYIIHVRDKWLWEKYSLAIGKF